MIVTQGNEKYELTKTETISGVIKLGRATSKMNHDAALHLVPSMYPYQSLFVLYPTYNHLNQPHLY